MARGRLLVGTSGFGYPGWAPRFYPPGARSGDLLGLYADRFPTVELNNTFYQRPTEARIRAWVAATPPAFRFVVKAQRGSAVRALLQDPAGSVGWLTEPLPAFGERLGAVLFRIPAVIRREHPDRDDARLAALLGAWPAGVPLCLEFQDPSWHVDETLTALRAAGAAMCATELPDDDRPPAGPAIPDLRRTGPFLYLRLRRHEYDDRDLAAWAGRLEPFLADGVDAFVFFRHDEDGRATAFADRLRELVEGA